MAFLEQLKKLAAALSMRQKISLAVASVLVAGALFWFSRWYTDRDYEVLARGLSAEDAGQVMARLKETGADYRIDSATGAVRVRSARVAELRLQLAAEGLPKTGRAGFEIFDKVNLGTTEFAEKINFQRALEGELERSVATISEVRSARIHLTPPKESIFLDRRQEAKASVLLTLRDGAALDAKNVQAITHLVASAVDGLSPEQVSILDSQGNLLNRPRRQTATGEVPEEAILEFRQAIERDLLAKINSTLDPLLGAERFRAAVTVDCDFSTNDESEESFDPARSVMASSQRTEDISGVNQASGVPGTSSTLPRATSRPGASGAGATRRTENMTYQTSRLVRRTHSPQGVIRRVSASVLLDHNVRTVGGKSALEAPSADTLRVTRDVIAGVLGLQPTRGDQLIVEALPFESTLALVRPLEPAKPVATTTAVPARRFQLPNLTRQQWIYVGAGAGVLVLLLGAGVFFLLKRRKKRPSVTVTSASIEGQAEHDPDDPSSIADTIGHQLAENAALKKKQEQELLMGLKLPGATTSKAEVLVKRLAEEAKRDPAAFAQVVRTWMSDSDS